MTSYVLTNPTPHGWDHSYSILSGEIHPNEPSPKYMQRFDEIICDFLRENGVPGAALHVTLHGRPVYSQGYGINRAGRPVSSTSQFRIASISKIFTAVAVLQLCQDKGVPLDQTVFGTHGILREKFCHITANNKQCSKITVRDLLQHSAGWDREKVGDHVFWYQKDMYRLSGQLDGWNNQKLVELVLQKDLQFSPGERHAYSNFGYLILGMVIEELSGMTYEHYVKSLLRKIGIEDVYIGHTDQHIVDYEEVKYYNNKDPPVEVSILKGQRTVMPQYGSFPMETTGSYGGWVTCAQNLVLLLDSLAFVPGVPEILPEFLVKQMLCQPKITEDPAWYGLGLDIEDNGQSFGHTGAMEGTSTTVHHENNFTWALLLNSWSKDMDLDGLVKYALSTIKGLAFWHGPDVRSEFGDYFVMSEDKRQCVQILLPHHRLITHVMEMKALGFMIQHVNALTLPDCVKFNIVWRKTVLGPNKWGILIDIGLESFEDCMANLKEKWRVYVLEAYQLNNKVYHIFVYEKKPSKTSFQQKIFAVSDKKLLGSCLEHYRKDNLILISQSVFSYNGEFMVSCILEKQFPSRKQTWETWLNLPVENYVTSLGTAILRNQTLAYIQFYRKGDEPCISAVWHKKKFHNVFQRHDVTKYGFLFELRVTLQSNRKVLFVSAYEYEGVVYFATLWDTNLRTEHQTSNSEVVNNRSTIPASAPKQQRAPRKVLANEKSKKQTKKAKKKLQNLNSNTAEIEKSIETGNENVCVTIENVETGDLVIPQTPVISELTELDVAVMSICQPDNDLQQVTSNEENDAEQFYSTNITTPVQVTEERYSNAEAFVSSQDLVNEEINGKTSICSESTDSVCSLGGMDDFSVMYNVENCEVIDKEPDYNMEGTATCYKVEQEVLEEVVSDCWTVDGEYYNISETDKVVVATVDNMCKQEHMDEECVDECLVIDAENNNVVDRFSL